MFAISLTTVGLDELLRARMRGRITIESLKEYMFAKENGVKKPFEPKASIIEKMSLKEYEIQIYVQEAPEEMRKVLESICEEVWKETEPAEIFTQA